MRYLLLSLCLIGAVIYALPNLYGEDIAIQITSKREDKVRQLEERLKKIIAEQNIIHHGLEVNNNSALLRFRESRAQLSAKDVLKEQLGPDYVVALNLAQKTPLWLRSIGAMPMKLGLDLRGGVHFLLEVDLDSAIKRYQEVEHSLSALEEAKLRGDLMEQTLVTLRKRVNELGVSEALTQRQGNNRIVVELPGIQDTADAKDLLGKTATLKFLLQESTDVSLVLSGGKLNGATVYYDRARHPVLLKNKPLLTGDAIVYATSGTDRDGLPIVSIRLGGNIDAFTKATLDNVGKRMGVVYSEIVDNRLSETVISLATIQTALGNNFQITGLSPKEARDLALMLRSGSLPTTLKIVEESVVGPSLGQDNIEKGILSIGVGFAAILVFMTIYYSLFGFIANIALLMNLVLIIAGMSIMGATLTLPGIAGIVLTLGMAVDANVLIFERIREELRNGMGKKAAIERGFSSAFGTILDSNLTTLIAGVVLFAMGTGPIKGFAVTLCLGIITTLITAVSGTKALVALRYSSPKPLLRISIGI